MSENFLFDQLIKNVRVVRPNQNSVEPLDIGIKDGKFTEISPILIRNSQKPYLMPIIS